MKKGYVCLLGLVLVSNAMAEVYCGKVKSITAVRGVEGGWGTSVIVAQSSGVSYPSVSIDGAGLTLATTAMKMDLDVCVDTSLNHLGADAITITK